MSRNVIAWNVDVGSGSCYLFASKTATLRVKDGVVEGMAVIDGPSFVEIKKRIC